MSQAHNHLKSLGVSCDLSDLLVATALEHGALGAKMSGGGLGGCIIALTSTEDQAQTIVKKTSRKRSHKHVDRKPVSVKSYANIAIVKYWGKADAERMIPSTSSISLTLENMYTETKLSFLPEDATGDVMYIDDELQEEKETIKASKVLDLFRTNPNQHVKIETWNNMPTAAGLSSSSSGLSALVKAANELFQVGKTQSELAQIAKFASGSSSRSFFGPLAAWDKDSGEVYQVETDLKLAMIMLVLTDQKKPVST